MNMKMEENQRVKWGGKDTTWQLLTDADKLCCSLSTVLGNDGFLIIFSLLFSSWKIVHWCYTNSVSVPFVYKVGQLGFSLGEPWSWICRWQMWIVLSIWSWEEFFQGLMSYLHWSILQSSFPNFLCLISWYPYVWQGYISWPHFLLSLENLFFGSTSWLLVHGKEDSLESQRLKKRSEVFILVYKC